MPVAPKPFVDQILGILRIMLHDQREHRMTDLRVAGLIRLDTGDHFLEQMVASFMCKRREAYELKVRKPGFENYVGGDGEFDGVLAEGEFVEEVPGRDGEPVVGVIEL